MNRLSPTCAGGLMALSSNLYAADLRDRQGGPDPFNQLQDQAPSRYSGCMAASTI